MPDASVSQPLTDHLELLAEMSRDFAFAEDVHTALTKALERIADYMDAEGGALFLFNEAEETLVCEASTGPVDITGLTLKADQGIVGRSVQENRGEIVRDVSLDSGFKGGVDKETGFTTRSILCAPMSVKDERLGAIEVLNKRGGDGLFSDADLHMLMALSASAGMAILNARMAASLVEQEKVKRELELAREIQSSLLPSRPREDFPLYAFNQPARAVSGDFYDFFELEDGRIVFNLADVSGKGMDASLLMAQTSSVFRCLGRTIHSPGELLDRVNTEVCETATHGKFVTMAGGIFDPKTGIVRLANAGHEPPVLRLPDGAYHEFPADAPPIGIAPGIAGGPFPEVEIDLQGGALYLFTDGVTEGHLEDGSMLGQDGLREILDRASSKPLKERVDTVIEYIYRGGAILHDDLTMLAIEDRR